MVLWPRPFWSRTLLVAIMGWMMGLTACQALKPAITALPGTVEAVISGQTLTIRLVGKTQSVQVRLWGLDAPDRQQQPWGNTARDYLKEAVLGKQVQVAPLQSEPDRYGRLLAYLWCNGTLINEALVAGGLGLVNLQRLENQPSERNTQYDQRLIWAQQRARILELGVWNPQLPLRQTPTEFRQQFPQRRS